MIPPAHKIGTPLSAPAEKGVLSIRQKNPRGQPSAGIFHTTCYDGADRAPFLLLESTVDRTLDIGGVQQVMCLFRTRLAEEVLIEHLYLRIFV